MTTGLNGAGIPTPAGQSLPQALNLFKFLLFTSSLQLSFWGVTQLLPLVEFTPLRLLLIGGAATLNCILIIGLGVLAHDAVHRVLFRNALANETIGGICSAMFLTPFHANRQFHLTHHGNAHQPGRDPENPMHHRPFWQAMTVGSMIGLYTQYRILLVNLFTRFNQPRFAYRVVMDLLFIAVSVLFFIVLPQQLGSDLFWTVLPTWLAFPIVFSVRAISDHYGVPPVQPKRGGTLEIADGMDWYDAGERVRITGWVVLTHPVLEWMWSSVNYHEVHHKYPWLSHVHLKSVFEKTREQEPYLVVNGYLRSLLHLARRPYYEQPERLRAYLTRYPLTS